MIGLQNLYECYEYTAQPLLRLNNEYDISQRMLQLSDLYRDKILAIYNLVDEKDLFELRYNLLIQVLSLISDQFICFEDKKAMILFIVENSWMDSLNDNQKEVVMKAFEKCLEFELKQIEAEYEEIYAEIMNKDLIEKTFKINKGRLVMRQNDKEVLGKCPFITYYMNKFEYDGYVAECNKYQINPLPVSIKVNKNIQEIYMDFLLKISDKIKPHLNELIQSKFQQFHHQFEPSSIKPYQFSFVC